jgi:hypothetical protein
MTKNAREKLLRRFLNHLHKTGALTITPDQLEVAVKKFSGAR